MGLFDRFFAEFIDVIEWMDDSHDTIIYRFQRYGDEIKYGAKLTVRESQLAVFVNEGEIADVIAPGMYELETKNLPILSTLQHWDHGFQSPFKAEVYFCNTKQFVDLKWGTKNPIMLRDKEFGAVRLRAYGTYAIRITDPVKFIKEIAGTDSHFTVDEVSNQLRNLIISRFTNIAGKASIPILDLAANYDQLGTYLTQQISPEFQELGVELTKILIENISLPSSVEEALDKRTSMGMIGNLDQYIKYQSAEALGSGGSASSAMDMGMGFAMANKMAGSLDVDAKESTLSPPPLVSVETEKWYVAINNEPSGPHTTKELKALIGDNKLLPNSLVWAEGMTDWVAASEVEQVSKLIPPPLS
ncbi:MAG: SPFH domain-containing protein [Thiotrichaceae bacterium]|nr:SPFH domain-containing protein [Thiotrichaceae bacterium]